MEKKRRYLLFLPGLLLLTIIACRREAPSDPLKGTLWVVTECLGQKAVAGTRLTLSFENGQVRGSSGCNTYFGSYSVSGSRIDVAQLAATKMACQEPGVMKQQGAFLATLAEVKTYRLEEDRLELVRTDGQTIVLERGDRAE